MSDTPYRVDERIIDLSHALAGLIRFIPKNGSSPVIGEPVNADQDVGLASYKSESIEVETFSGSSILQPGSRTGKKVQVERIVSPLAQEEVGTIRCVGLNVSVAWRLCIGSADDSIGS